MPFKNIDTDSLDTIAGHLRNTYHLRHPSERVWKRYTEVRSELDRRHEARLARSRAYHAAVAEGRRDEFFASLGRVGA